LETETEAAAAASKGVSMMRAKRKKRRNENIVMGYEGETSMSASVVSSSDLAVECDDGRGEDGGGVATTVADAECGCSG